MIHTLKSPLAAALLAFVAPLAAAQQICHTRDVPLTTTNWRVNLTFPQFDPALGILTGVSIEMTSRVQGSLGIESLDAAPSISTSQYAAQVTLRYPDATVALQDSPSVGFTDSLTAFDGVIDFGGTSGVFHGGIDVSSMSTTNAPPALLPAFVGLGTVTFGSNGNGTSVVTGPGNVVSQIQTRAGTSVRVCYSYLPDCDGDGIPDADEIAMGAPDRYGPNTCVADGIPDSCQPEPDCDSDGLPDRCALLLGLAFDRYGVTTCTPDGIPDNCQPQPDCDGDGDPDRCEILNGTATDLDGDGIPDNCQPDCDGDGIPDVVEIANGAPDRYGPGTCTPDGIPDECQPELDCDNDGIPDRCEIAAGAQDIYGAMSCMPDGIPDVCQPQPDCDNDGIPDRCEIAAGAADRYGVTTCTPDGIPDVCQPQPDCDNDGIPDRCEIAAGAADRYGVTTCTPDGIPDVCQPQPDCDNDGIPDRCEIAAGAADRYGVTTCTPDGIPDVCQPQPDCDNDGIPDRCEIAAGAADRYGPNTCTPDGVPDVCQPQPDCDNDGLPDRCEPDTDGDGIPDDCDTPGGTQGCTPGYWKNHLDAWPATGYGPSQDFDLIFGVDAFSPNRTLLRAISQGGGGINALGRHAVAALLSASHPNVAYPLTPADVITLVRNAVLSGDYEPTKNLLDGYNNLGCPLN